MRPFKVLGIQQVAIGNESKDKLSKFWGDIMGLTKVHTYKSEKENVDEDIYRIGNGAFAVEVDLMMPIDANKSPKVHDPHSSAALYLPTAQGLHTASCPRQNCC